MPITLVGYVLIALFTNTGGMPTTSITAYFVDEAACNAALEGIKKNSKDETVRYISCIPQNLQK